MSTYNKEQQDQQQQQQQQEERELINLPCCNIIYWEQQHVFSLFVFIIKTPFIYENKNASNEFVYYIYRVLNIIYKYDEIYIFLHISYSPYDVII